jgi:hypothetical protein
MHSNDNHTEECTDAIIFGIVLESAVHHVRIISTDKFEVSYYNQKSFIYSPNFQITIGSDGDSLLIGKLWLTLTSKMPLIVDDFTLLSRNVSINSLFEVEKKLLRKAKRQILNGIDKRQFV